MRIDHAVWVLTSAVAAAACSSPPDLASDAGSSADSGSPDAGSTPDSGMMDASTPDSGTALDAGFATMLLPCPSAIAFGGAADDGASWATADSRGRFLIAGSFNTSFDIAGQHFDSAGYRDSFLAALPADGGQGWARSWGGSGNDFASIVIADATGATVIGDLEGQFSIGDKPVASQDQSDAYLARFDLDGNVQWVRTVPGMGASVTFSATPFPGGGILVSGVFFGTTDFGTSATPLDLNGVWAGHFSSGGQLLWATPITSGDPEPTATALDADGNSYLCGHFTNLMSTPVAQVAAFGNSSDGFLLGLSNVGGVRFLVAGGSQGNDFCEAVATNGTSVYAIYSFNSAATWPDAGTVAAGRQKTLLTFDRDGALQAHQTLSTDDTARTTAMWTDVHGRVVLAGTVEAGDTVLGITPPNNGSEDIFIATLSPVDVRTFGGADYDVPSNVLPYGGSLVLGGTFAQSMQIAGTQLNASGGHDGFAACVGVWW